MTENLRLQHTRGVPLRNLCLLCIGLRELGAGASRRSLMLAGRDLGLGQFKSVEPSGSLPTRVRHHEYALRELELIGVQGPLCSLTAKGTKLAEVSEACDIQPVDRDAEEADTSLPEPVRTELRRLLCSSRYVTHWWLRYFMPTDQFSLADFSNQARDVIIELMPPDERVTDEGRHEKRFKDSGYRVHSYFSERRTLPLDESGRREIHEGLRQWCMRIDLVSEVLGWDSVFEIEAQYAGRMESQSSRLSRVYVVRKRLDMDSEIRHFEDLLSAVRARLGNPQRMQIPVLLMHLALEEGLSVRRTHELLRRLHDERRGRYFFEPASSWLIAQPGNPFGLDSYVNIAGTWRTSIVFPN